MTTFLINITKFYKSLQNADLNKSCRKLYFSLQKNLQFLNSNIPKKTPCCAVRIIQAHIFSILVDICSIREGNYTNILVGTYPF